MSKAISFKPYRGPSGGWGSARSVGNILWREGIPASGALVMNLVMIASVYLLAPRMGKSLDQQIFGLAIGALVAGRGPADSVPATRVPLPCCRTIRPS